MDEEIERYRRIIRAGFDYKLTRLIDNGMPEHAAVLYEQFFLHSKDIVRMFCKNLSKEVFDFPFVADAGRRAIKNGVTLDILLQDEKPEPSYFSMLLEDHNINYLQVPEGDLRTRKINFSVMDRQAFRYERDNVHLTAQACAYDMNRASELADKFDFYKARTKGIK